jgi:hypothetical protein
MRMRQVLAAAGAMVLVAGGLTLAGAVPVSADQIWHQSIGRAGATATCPDPSDGDLMAGWSKWGASWEQWENDGNGGFTCTRSIAWAKNSAVPNSLPAHPSAECVFFYSGQYANFLGGWYLSVGQVFANADCSTPIGSHSRIVYAPAGYDAVALCEEALAPLVDLVVMGPYGDHIYSCTEPV